MRRHLVYIYCRLSFQENFQNVNDFIIFPAEKINHLPVETCSEFNASLVYTAIRCSRLISTTYAPQNERNE